VRFGSVIYANTNTNTNTSTTRELAFPTTRSQPLTRKQRGSGTRVAASLRWCVRCDRVIYTNTSTNTNTNNTRELLPLRVKPLTRRPRGSGTRWLLRRAPFLSWASRHRTGAWWRCSERSRASGRRRGPTASGPHSGVGSWKRKEKEECMMDLLGLYTILPLPILCGVWHTRGGLRVCRILRISRVQ